VIDYTSLITLGMTVVVVLVFGFVVGRTSEKKRAERNKSSSIENKKEEQRAGKRVELAKSVKKIVWEDHFVVDNGIIDKDHMVLFDLINKFNANTPKYRHPKEMVPILNALIKYTQIHFKREEKLQKASGYPFQDDHKKEHADLIKNFHGLVLKAQKANRDNVSDVAVEIGQFLKDWLILHVVENDMTLKPFVEKMKETAGSMKAMKTKGEGKAEDETEDETEAETEAETEVETEA